MKFIVSRHGAFLDGWSFPSMRPLRGLLGMNGPVESARMGLGVYRTRAISARPDCGERAINAENIATHGRPRRPLVLVRDAGPASRSISRYRSEPLRAGARR